jgi:eukaryotic-like serine/threonine-protein kinase
MSPAISPNTTLAQYTILSKLGEGGMGEVWRARDTKLGRDVAIKVLPAAFAADEERLRRFEQEAQAAGALNHPNTILNEEPPDLTTTSPNITPGLDSRGLALP